MGFEPPGAVIDGSSRFTHHESPVKLLVTVRILVSLCGIYIDVTSWDEYASRNHCVPVGTQDPSWTYDSSGKTVYLPAKTIYRCNGGEMRIR